VLQCFVPEPQGLVRLEPTPEVIPAGCLWLDLLDPTPAEEQAVERLLGVEVPTREEMKEIETSSRLYEERGALYMTATVVARIDSDRPEATAVTFILAGNTLITNRHLDPLPFRRFASYAARHPGSTGSGLAVLAGLLESIIERMADTLERISLDIDELSADIFARPATSRDGTRDLRAILERIGRTGELISKSRESLVTIGRVLGYLQQSGHHGLVHEIRSRLKSLSRDTLALSDHASFISGKTTFLLEATLGLINIEQNNIIKIFSVAAVAFLPPTLIASIYGMNFHFLPELDWPLGYPLALLMMLASAIVPYLYFRRRGWL